LSRTDHVALGSGIGTSRGRLEAEVIVLRHQLNILRRQSPRRVRLNAFDRAIVSMYQMWFYKYSVAEHTKATDTVLLQER